MYTHQNRQKQVLFITPISFPYYWAIFNPDFKNTTISPTEYFKTETTYDSTGEFEIAVSDNRSADIKTENSYNTTKGLLTNTTTPNGQTTSYTYDNASGIRTGKDDITYEYDGDKIVREIRPNAVLRYFYDNSGVCGFQYSNSNYYFMRNMQGDITAIYDTNGNLMAEYVYDAWGNHTITTDIGGIGTLNPFRYRGYYFDTETGLYYLKSRYYDPQMGRFINADCYINANGDILGFNMFAYCGNNPVMNSDPSGQAIITTIIVGTVLGMVFGASANIGKQLINNGGQFDQLDVGSIINSALVGGALGLSTTLGVTYLGAAIAGAGVSTSTIVTSFATSVAVSAAAGGAGYVIEETMNSRSENITINKVLGHAGIVAFEGAYSFGVGGLTGSMYNAGSKGNFLSKEWFTKFIIGQEFSQPIKMPLDMLRNNLWG